MYLLIYVDDVLIFGDQRDELQKLCVTRSKNFEIRIEETVNKFLGMLWEIRDNDAVIQAPAVKRILKQFQMENCRAVSCVTAYRDCARQQYVSWHK